MNKEFNLDNLHLIDSTANVRDLISITTYII